MRKILIALASILILALTIYIIIAGVGFAKINGYKDIDKINKELDLKILAINGIKERDYLAKQKDLDVETSTLRETREDYLAKVEAARIKGAKGSKLQIEIYELDFIWARIGNYASDLGLEIKLDVFPGTEEKLLHDFKLYNLKMSVVGEYIDIVRFIYKIEGDREISAQLSDFSMRPMAKTSADPEEGDEVETETTSPVLTLGAEFTLKNVPLNYRNLMEEEAKEENATNIEDLKLPADMIPDGETPEDEAKPKEEDKKLEEDVESILGS